MCQMTLRFVADTAQGAPHVAGNLVAGRATVALGWQDFGLNLAHCLYL